MHLSKMVNSSVINKNDINIELRVDNNNPEDQVSSLRLYVPEQKSQQMGKEDSESAMEEEMAQAQKVNQMIIEKAELQNISGDSLVTILDVPLQVPRGKYTVDIYDTYIKFHGSTFNYKVESKNIDKAFLLPKPDDLHVVFVLALKQSVRQGNTVYPYILMQFNKD